EEQIHADAHADGGYSPGRHGPQLPSPAHAPAASPRDAPVRGAPVRIAYDAAPLLNPRTGVGHYAAALLHHLLEADPELGVSLFAVGRQRTPAALPGGDGRTTFRRLKVPARVAVMAWEASGHPVGERLVGRVDA